MRKAYVVMATAAILLAVLLGAWSVIGYMDTKDIEEPVYTVVNKGAGYEIRAYAPQIRAEVVLEGSYRESLYGGFRQLADFIFGNNTTNTGIDMTAPVISEKSQKIAMTAPVLHEQNDGQDKHVVSFIMPGAYTMETLPRPNNSAVTLRQIPEQRFAVVKFRGYATEGRANRRIKNLIRALERDGIAIRGQAQIAQYNPPWTPPYMRRNEILIPIE